MVNRDRVQLLVDALESDEFGQCKGSLRMPTQDGSYTYCCLGVATEVALRNGLPEEVDDSATNLFCADGRPTVWNHSGGQLLSTEVMDWYGFTTSSPTLLGHRPYWPQVGEPGKVGYRAHQWNDSFDANFHEIAAMFRETYLEPETPATD